MPNRSKVAFDNGVVKVLLAKDKKTAVFLAFHPMNKGHEKYEALEKAMPRLHGLRRKSHRAVFAYDVIQKLQELGFEITKKQTNDNSNSSVVEEGA